MTVFQIERKNVESGMIRLVTFKIQLLFSFELLIFKYQHQILLRKRRGNSLLCLCIVFISSFELV